MISWQEIEQQYEEANFLQSPEYGKMNELLGCTVIQEDFGGKGWAQMIVRDARRGRYLEVPCGPLCDWNNEDTARAIIERIGEVGREKACVFMRIRPQIYAESANLALLSRLGLKRAPMHLAAEHTVMLDLTQSTDSLLAEMRRQTRYEVRRAAKLGITVTRGNTEADFKEFHAVQMATAKRQNFVPPSLDTLMAERKAFGKKIWIYKALTSDGAPIAYGLIIRGGREGDYYEAASTELNRKLPGAYALIWQVIQDLKEEGCERFNLWGIAPPGEPGHRYAGVTTFKTGFGGKIVEYVPAQDLILSRVKYLKDYVVEKARKKRRHL
ncbi:peptidoglycan bridge formation glycyltransferase FemA/FemB family protein [Candidatus Saccharibacteria bacterium]|nr:peptidoglycan bridge formation glycyltransferase FemA/FemB family protein [Candidatus Saccharibacteria bacterium]